MLDRGRTVLIAVSGGPDSVAMLHVLYRLRQAFDLTLIVAHLDHQMRPEAVEDAHFVSQMAAALGLHCVCASHDVPAYQRRHKLSPEDAARQVRYAFLRATATQHGADRIALGHTADDQAETVLLRLLRGAGLQGLVGIPPVRGAIIRPLIQVRRRDILAVLQTQHIAFREDPSNQHRRYTRNRLRLDVLPLLQRQYNPHLVEAFGTTARLLADDDAALQAMAGERWRAVRWPGRPGEVCLHIDPLNECLPAIQRRIVREALREASGSLQGFSHRHIATILRLCGETAGSKWVTLPRRVIAERRYQVLHIRQGTHAAPVPRAAQSLPIPGRCPIEELGLVVESQLLDRQTVSAPFPSGKVAWLDATAVGGEVWVRTRCPGDRFQPLGCAHPKKLKAFLIDAKVPRAVRDRLALVVTGQGIAWVAGMQVAEWAKVTLATSRILCLRVSDHGGESTLSRGQPASQALDFPIVFQ